MSLLRTAVALALLATAAPILAQTPPADPTGLAKAADIQAQVATMAREMKPEQHFAWRPLLRDGGTTAALEYWTAPGKPAIHPTDAEYTIVIEGAGTLVSGGRMIDPVTTKSGMIEGSRIEGGTTRDLKPGDVVLIPAGIPHWFGITGGKLVLLGMKLARPAK
ncbi:cupin domain-containing protein [Sphingomonas populi]|uniref:Cupin domain-containing protein n=1 Tax=Sphingomonas populi TaxID=2484750 RepID=A0A4Q6XX39_9SPHN|nr:cupin domain-containing protein [Sphingomonas populi]RZF64655.1 cupin domain-containing protein [Sphingomonas populi]